MCLVDNWPNLLMKLDKELYIALYSKGYSVCEIGQGLNEEIIWIS